MGNEKLQYILGSKPLVAIGLISYPLYLWHWPILSFLRIISEEGGLPKGLKILASILSVGLAYLTYRYIEKPLRFSRNSYVFFGLILSLILTGTISLLIFYQNGVDTRFPTAEANAQQFQLMSKGNFSNLPRIDCKLFSIKNEGLGCYIANPQKKPSIIALGDSHAVHNTIGLVDYLTNSNQNFSIIYQAGCLPYFNTQVFRGEIETCSNGMKQALDFTIETKEIKTVLLTSRGSWYIHGGDFKSNTGGFKIGILGNDSMQNSSDIFYKGLHDTIYQLIYAGKKVIFVIDNPELGFNPKHCSKSRPLYLVDNYNADCAQSIGDTREYDKEYKEIIKKIINEFPSIKVLDAPKYLCDNSKCYAKIDDTILYSDKNHLSLAGSAFIGEKFFHEIGTFQ